MAVALLAHLRISRMLVDASNIFIYIRLQPKNDNDVMLLFFFFFFVVNAYVAIKSSV